MWYGTGGGLCRDNGFQVDVFRADREQADQMPSNDVLCIAENRAQHEIWFGTKAGAFILSKADYSIRAVDAAPFTLTDRHINALLAARDGSLWVSLRDSVLHFDSDDKLMGSVHSTWHGKKAQVTTLAETADGQIFVTQWNAGWGRIADSFEELPWSLGAYPSWIADDPAHACLWVGTWGEGIVKVSKEDFRPMPLRMSQVAPEQSRQVLSLQVDSVRGLLWSTTMSGLNAYKDSAPTATFSANSVLDLGVNKATTTTSAGCTQLAGLKTVTINGLVRVRLASSYDAAVGDSIKLVSATTIKGTPTFELPELPAGLYWDTANFIGKGLLRIAAKPVGINDLPEDETVNRESEGSQCYDLSGRTIGNGQRKMRTGQLSHGVYIMEGRKVLSTPKH